MLGVRQLAAAAALLLLSGARLRRRSVFTDLIDFQGRRLDAEKGLGRD